uniref:VWFC domain-containing protein n=5 Tax=Magallana gigas TaxID=29159 RepID=A0A8W8JW71_MAGGI
NNMVGSSTPAPNAFNVVPIGSHNTIYGSNEIKPGSNNPFTASGGYSACIYKGVQHREGESWQDGCDYVCTCVNAKMGEYKCVSKCPVYPPTLPTYCRKVAIPGQCCPKLSCDIPGTNGSYVPPSEVQITPAPTMPDGSFITAAPFGGLSGQVVYTMPTNPPTTTVPAFPGQGFPISQSQITMVRDQCIFPSKNGNQFLIYNEGEQWNDGCDYTCTCKDGSSGYYECISSCPTYNNLESSRCYMVRVDGKCCSEPRCTLANGQVVDPTKVQTSFPIVPSLSGGYVNFRPDTNYAAMGSGGYSNMSGSRNVCIYKGRQYQQSQSWSDGCDFDCRCDDASTGQFSCTPRCPVYTELPSFCTLDTVPGDCCKKLNCPHVVPVGTTTTPKPTKPSCEWCKDTLSTCESYGQQACVAPYVPWAKRNCPNYCNLCEYDCAHTPPTTTPLPFGCRDKLDNCQDYGKDSCTGIFEPWARENCQAFCSYCGSTTAQSVCHDESPEVCAQMDISICTSIAYSQWAQKNCMKTCNMCAGGSGLAMTTAAPKACRYSDGVTHAHGTWWQDGCSADAKNCTCNDGIAKCLRLCPKFENLPSGWQVVQVAGQCCPVVKVVATNACYYNGVAYGQDQTWSENCKLTCKCTDAARGFYQCSEMCPQLQLPDVCHWESPPAGKCCRRPICPSYIQIQGYPDV